MRIPPVVIAIEFNQHIDAADEGMGAVHDRDFLMQGLDWVMQNAMGAVIEDVGHAYLGEFLMRCFGIVV